MKLPYTPEPLDPPDSMELAGPRFPLHYWGKTRNCYTKDIFFAIALQIWYEGDPGHMPEDRALLTPTFNVTPATPKGSKP